MRTHCNIALFVFFICDVPTFQKKLPCGAEGRGNGENSDWDRRHGMAWSNLDSFPLPVCYSGRYSRCICQRKETPRIGPEFANMQHKYEKTFQTYWKIIHDPIEMKM